jgi:hypothetical protein
MRRLKTASGRIRERVWLEHFDVEEPATSRYLLPYGTYVYACAQWEAESVRVEQQRFDAWALERLEMLLLGPQWVLDPPPRVETWDYALVVLGGVYRPVHRTLLNEARNAGARVVLPPEPRPTIRQLLTEKIATLEDEWGLPAEVAGSRQT